MSAIASHMPYRICWLYIQIFSDGDAAFEISTNGMAFEATRYTTRGKTLGRAPPGLPSFTIAPSAIRHSAHYCVLPRKLLRMGSNLPGRLEEAKSGMPLGFRHRGSQADLSITDAATYLAPHNSSNTAGTYQSASTGLHQSDIVHRPLDCRFLVTQSSSTRDTRWTRQRSALYMINLVR